MTAPSLEDFERWRDDFVTRWVFKALAGEARRCEEQWHAASWKAGVSNPAAEPQLMNLLRELRTRADTYRAIMDTPYDGFCESLGEEPNVERLRA